MSRDVLLQSAAGVGGCPDGVRKDPLLLAQKVGRYYAGVVTDQARPLAERTLWSLSRGDHDASAVARAWTHGVDLAVVLDNEVCWSQLFGTDVDALASTAELKRRAWAACGWLERVTAKPSS